MVKVDSPTIRPVASTVGAEVDGIDLGGDISDETLDVLRVALHQYGVLFFRQQSISSDDDQLALAKRFGPIYQHPLTGSSHLTVLDSAASIFRRRPPPERRVFL